MVKHAHSNYDAIKNPQDGSWIFRWLLRHIQVSWKYMAPKQLHAFCHSVKLRRFYGRHKEALQLVKPCDHHEFTRFSYRCRNFKEK